MRVKCAKPGELVVCGFAFLSFEFGIYQAALFVG
jgi:hypothetical protein